MKTYPHLTGSCAAGFTVVELIVSTALIAALMLMLLGTVDQTQRLFTRSTGKIAQFQGARAGYESMTRRLSQATLNTYWRMHDTDVKDSTTGLLYRRHSELQFISGPAARIFNPAPKITGLSQPIGDAYPTHAVFFQAPLGYSVEPETRDKDTPEAKERKFRALDGLLSACGYFIEFGDDFQKPDFLENLTPPFPARFRYRLMEMTVPSERLTIYQRPLLLDKDVFADPRIFNENRTYYAGMVDKDRKPIGNFVRPLWLGKEAAFQRELATVGGGYRFKFAHPIAENIVALIILPKLAESDRPIDKPDQLELAPNYEYDSWRIINGSAAPVSSSVLVLRAAPNALPPIPRDVSVSVKLDNSTRDNLLPPIVQVTMVAIDEASAIRLNFTPDKLPMWLKDLFKEVKTEDQFQADLKELQDRIAADKSAGTINFRVFSTDVVIRGSKWSRERSTP